MDRPPDQGLPSGDTFELSDDEPLPPDRSQHGSLFSTIGSSDLGQNASINRDDYTDDDIKMIYDIIVRADTILTEELTPTSRLPTHALFLAYDEIIAENGIDPSERHISKVIFMVGGVKDQQALMDKFRTVMTRMGITLAVEDPQDSRGEHEDQEGQGVRSDVQDPLGIDNAVASTSYGGEAEFRAHQSRPGPAPEFLGGPLDTAKERLLAGMAETFRTRHHDPFWAASALRRWHSMTQYINYLCADSDTTRAGEWRNELGEKFYFWRSLAAEAADAIPDKVPSNAYSKRTERNAIRACEILATKKAVVKWRQAAKDENRRSQDAKLLADRLARQQIEDDSFKENPQLARLAQRVHRNLALSRAFATWSNRAEEEGVKAEVAAKAYEVSLKAKALGTSRNQEALDAMKKLLASRISSTVARPVDGMAAPATRQPEAPVPGPAPGSMQPTPAVTIPSRPRAPFGRPLSSLAIATQLQSRRVAEKQPVQPSTVVPVAPAPSAAAAAPAPAAAKSAVARNRPSAPPVKPILATDLIEDDDTSDDDQPDERTMLARRHILRMRYFGAWERYTSENITKVEQFREEKHDQKVTRSVSLWRDRTISRQCLAVERTSEFEGNRSFRTATKAVLKWKERARQEAHHQKTVLEYYAGRAEYYQKTTQALAVLKEKAGESEQKEKMLRRYAERSIYYLRTTNALPIWQERARVVSEKHQLEANYGERADYYYRTKNTVTAWQHQAKQRRKERLKEAHLETRRRVKKGMGERCVAQWRIKLESSYQRYDMMNVILEGILGEREWRQVSQALATWRYRAREMADASVIGDDALKRNAMRQWREKVASQSDLEVGAAEHWERRAKSRALRNWNLGSLKNAHRLEMVANVLEKKERRIQRHGFETWYARTADKLVPVALPDGTYRNIDQIVDDARLQASENHARGALRTWRATTATLEAMIPPPLPRPSPPPPPPPRLIPSAPVATPAPAVDRGMRHVPNEAYAPTPGRPQLLLGSFGRRETTTPMAPVPSQSRWQPRASAMGRSEFGQRVGRPERSRNLRVSWAA